MEQKIKKSAGKGDKNRCRNLKKYQDNFGKIKFKKKINNPIYRARNGEESVTSDEIRKG